jgi:predicted HicB family RNase H-like nuclease
MIAIYAPTEKSLFFASRALCAWRKDMNTKLTLRLDDQLIASAKEYSAQTGKSVSKIVSDFFIIIKNEKLKENNSITPTVQSLKGILKNTNVSKSDYKNYLEKKYL